MKWQRGPDPHLLYLQRLHGWHTWFAWHPITANCGTRVWLERVWRRGNRRTDWDDGVFWDWEYLLPNGDTEPDDERDWGKP